MTTLPTNEQALAELEREREEEARLAAIRAEQARHMADFIARREKSNAIERVEREAQNPALRLAKMLALRLGDDLQAFVSDLRQVNFVAFQRAIDRVRNDAETDRRTEQERRSRNLGLI